MIIFSDPHIGLDRKAHTTAQSRVKLREEIYVSALNAVKSEDYEDVVCVGDLFDTFSNSEADILSAARVAGSCNVVLAGNHDSKNQTEAVGSLHMVAELTTSTTIVRSEEFGEAYCKVIEMDERLCMFVPHQASQQMFDEVIASLTASGSAKYPAIFLHCNYDNDLTLSSDISLNLTSAQADKLLGFYDFIFLGHEHQPREFKDGRLIIVGNPFPTGFGDISDKYRWTLREGKLNKEVIWRKSSGYREIEFNGAEASSKIIDDDVRFVDVTGEVTSAQGAEVAEFIQQTWESSDNLLMVRNSVNIKSEAGLSGESLDLSTLPQLISKDLTDSELLPVWELYLGRTK